MNGCLFLASTKALNYESFRLKKALRNIKDNSLSFKELNDVNSSSRNDIKKPRDRTAMSMKL